MLILAFEVIAELLLPTVSLHFFPFLAYCVRLRNRRFFFFEVMYFLLKCLCFCRFRQTIAEADSMLSKLEADYQETIQCLQNEKTSLEEQVRMLEQSQGYLKNQLAKAISDTERQDQMADMAERLLATGNLFFYTM